MVSDTYGRLVDVDEYCLNPTFSGTWSLTSAEDKIAKGFCLNPTFSGTWSLTGEDNPYGRPIIVLILLFLEHGL